MQTQPLSDCQTFSAPTTNISQDQNRRRVRLSYFLSKLKIQEPHQTEAQKTTHEYVNTTFIITHISPNQKGDVRFSCSLLLYSRQSSLIQPRLRKLPRDMQTQPHSDYQTFSSPTTNISQDQKKITQVFTFSFHNEDTEALSSYQ